MPKELSGTIWVSRFLGSNSPDACSQPFKDRLNNFLDALAQAGATFTIAATLRPLQRAFLMRHAWLIANEQESPDHVDEMAGIDIEWLHRDDAGQPDLAASRAAAQEMVDRYGIEHEPKLDSLHIVGEAVDMAIQWQGNLTIARGDGTKVVISSNPKSGLNPQLHAVGATHGVIKLLSDKPHWSLTGH
jgi:hypothetical protein